LELQGCGQDQKKSSVTSCFEIFYFYYYKQNNVLALTNNKKMFWLLQTRKCFGSYKRNNVLALTNETMFWLLQPSSGKNFNNGDKEAREW
jgi:hypothetical protein